MPRKERTTRPDPEQLDLSTLLGDRGREVLSEDDAQARLAQTAARMEAEHAGDPESALWYGSPYQWVRNLATARKSKAAERLVAAALASQGIVPARSSGPGHDFTYAGERYKVRMSMRWASGEYVFQHVTGGDPHLVCLFGLSPAAAHLWVVAKDVLAEHATEGTGWLSFPVTHPPAWLAEHGGTLSSAADVIAQRRPNGF